MFTGHLFFPSLLYMQCTLNFLSKNNSMIRILHQIAHYRE